MGIYWQIALGYGAAAVLTAGHCFRTGGATAKGVVYGALWWLYWPLIHGVAGTFATMIGLSTEIVVSVIRSASYICEAIVVGLRPIAAALKSLYGFVAFFVIGYILMVQGFPQTGKGWLMLFAEGIYWPLYLWFVA
jgi:hypothetical protein